MKTLLKVLIPAAFALLAGCVVAPARGYYYGPRVGFVAPAPVVYVRP